MSHNPMALHDLSQGWLYSLIFQYSVTLVNSLILRGSERAICSASRLRVLYVLTVL
jgi:hypothetical protein